MTNVVDFPTENNPRVGLITMVKAAPTEQQAWRAVRAWLDLYGDDALSGDTSLIVAEIIRVKPARR
jgi:hypothetical protein